MRGPAPLKAATTGLLTTGLGLPQVLPLATMDTADPSPDAGMFDALRRFCEIAERELSRAPIEVPEAVETLAWRDVAFIRWGLSLLERDPAFASLVAATDAAYLDAI